MRTTITAATPPLPSDEHFSLTAIATALYAKGTSHIAPLPNTPAIQRFIQILRQGNLSVEQQNDRLTLQTTGRPQFAPTLQRVAVEEHTFLLRILLGIFASHPSPLRIEASGTAQRRSLHFLIHTFAQMGITIAANRYAAPPLTLLGTPSPKAITLHLPIPAFRLRFPTILAALCSTETSQITEPYARQLWDARLLSGVSVHQDPETGALTWEIDPHTTADAGEIPLPADFLLSSFFLLWHLLSDQPGMLPAQLLGAFTDSLPEFLLQTAQLAPAVPQPTSFRDPLHSHITDLPFSPAQLNLAPAVHPPSPYLHRYTIPFFAVLCAFYGVPFTLRNALDLRQMQTDWIAAIVDGLAGFGAAVEDTGDGFVLSPSQLHGGAVDCFGDEVIALAFLALALAIGDNSWMYNVPATRRIRFVLHHLDTLGVTSASSPSSLSLRVYNEGIAENAATSPAAHPKS